MKKIFCLLLFVSTVIHANCQQIFMETGMVLSSFSYKNSNDEKLEGLKGINQNGFGLGARMSLFKSPWHVSLEATNNKYGASRSDQVLGNFSEWSGTFIGLNLGVDYEFFKPEMFNADREGFSFYLKGIFSTEFLINGKQKLNSQVFNLAGEEEFDKPLFFTKGAIGLKFYITRSYVVFAQYLFGRSILLGNYSGQEKLHIITNTMSIGVSVDLFYRRNR